MSLRGFSIAVPKNRLHDLGRNSECEQVGRKSTSKSVPTVPALADCRSDYSTAQVVEVQRVPHLFASEEPVARPVLAHMGVEQFAKRFYYWNR